MRQLRSGSPVPGGSTLITSAPNHARNAAAKGPAIACPNSRILIPASGPASGVSRFVGLMALSEILGQIFPTFLYYFRASFLLEFFKGEVPPCGELLQLGV